MKNIFLIMLLVLLSSLSIYAGPNEDLLNSAKNNDLEGVKKALKSGANINIKDRNDYMVPGMSRIPQGDTALMKAVLKENVEIVKFLIESKANPNIKNNSGDTAIMYISRGETCTTEELEMLDLLIKAKANINIQERV